jgi:hypothetical protein
MARPRKLPKRCQLPRPQRLDINVAAAFANQAASPADTPRRATTPAPRRAAIADSEKGDVEAAEEDEDEGDEEEVIEQADEADLPLYELQEIGNPGGSAKKSLKYGKQHLRRFLLDVYLPHHPELKDSPLFYQGIPISFEAVNPIRVTYRFMEYWAGYLAKNAHLRHNPKNPLLKYESASRYNSAVKVAWQHILQVKGLPENTAAFGNTVTTKLRSQVYAIKSAQVS